MHPLGQVVDVNIFLCGRQSARLAWIETHGHYVKLFSDLKRQHAKRGHHAVEHLRAEHWAIVVDEREHHGFPAEILPELYCLSVFIAKDEIERQLLIEFLIDAHVAQRCRQAGRRISRFRACAVQWRTRSWRFLCEY